MIWGPTVFLPMTLRPCDLPGRSPRSLLSRRPPWFVCALWEFQKAAWARKMMRGRRKGRWRTSATQKTRGKNERWMPTASRTPAACEEKNVPRGTDGHVFWLFIYLFFYLSSTQTCRIKWMTWTWFGLCRGCFETRTQLRTLIWSRKLEVVCNLKSRLRCKHANSC